MDFRKMFAGLAVVASACFVSLGTTSTAVAEEVTISATTAAASEGCQVGRPPYNINTFVSLHEDGWFDTACEDCDYYAWDWAVAGYATWCWETAPGLAELWVGPHIEARTAAAAGR